VFGDDWPSPGSGFWGASPNLTPFPNFARLHLRAMETVVLTLCCHFLIVGIASGVRVVVSG